MDTPLGSVLYITLGCAKNEVDTDRMRSLLTAAGYEEAFDPQDADIAIVNTCSFLASATSESIETTLELANEVQDGVRSCPIVMCGCVPSRYGDDLPDELPEVAAFVKADEEGGIVAVIDGVLGVEREIAAYIPQVKRTVEGDLGMRVSAHATCRVGGKTQETALERAGISAERLCEYADQLAAHPDYLPLSAEDEGFDQALAGLCVGNACARHVGRSATVYTPEGEMQVQTGRDLRQVGKLIGSGGWLSRAENFSPADWLADHAVDKRGRLVLTPRDFTWYRDKEYLFPLLANLAREVPKAAALAGVNLLYREEGRGKGEG